MRLPSNDSATGRGIKTGVQAIGGLAVTFLIGLALAVWNVPGVPMAVLDYVQNNFVQVAAMVGVPAGVVGFVWNLFRPSVENY